MYAVIREPDEVRALFDRAKKILDELFLRIYDGRETVLIPRTDDLFEEAQRTGRFFILSEGNVVWSHEEKDIFVFESGDILGVAENSGVKAGRARTEFAVKAFEYSAAEFLSAIQADSEASALWADFLRCHYSAMTWFVILLMQGEKAFTPHVRSFEEGAVIIEQGSTGTDVFTLLDGGSANVMVDGVKVGEIRENQLFGVFAALTGSRRTATVTAASSCLAVAVSKEEFLDLIKHMPDLALKALTDMSHAITDLNSRIVKLAYRNPVTPRVV